MYTCVVFGPCIINNIVILLLVHKYLLFATVHVVMLYDVNFLLCMVEW